MTAVAPALKAAKPPDPGQQAVVKTSVVRALCHDCRTPLAVIADSASIVREELEDRGDAAEALEFLDGITRRAVEIEGLLSDFRFAHALGAEEPHGPVDPAPFHQLLGDVVPQFERVTASLGQKLDYRIEQDLPAGEIDGGVLARALTMAVTELCRPANTEATLRVTATAEPDGKWVRVTILRDEPATGGLQEADGSNDEQHRAPADEEELRFRLQAASAVIKLFGGRLTALRGSEHRALTIFLPVSQKAGGAWRNASQTAGATHREDGAR